jgi:riboflavin synthase
MFSGIVEGTGMVRSIEQRNGSAQLEIQADYLLGDANVGDSIAVNGVCLTMTSRLGNTFWADISEETLKVTTLERFHPGQTVNLEQALRYGGRVGGHLVQGHVDGVARIMTIRRQEKTWQLLLDVPLHLTRYIIKKGSIAIDGVSLTIAEYCGTEVTIAIIPHTWEVTAFDRLNVGDFVNLECDLIGKYIEKLAFLSSEAYHADERIGRAFRRKFGFH